VLNRVLFGMARTVCTSPYWVEIRGRQGEVEEPGPGELGWVAADRLFYIGDLFESSTGAVRPPVEFALLSFLRDPSQEPVSEAMKLPPTEPAPAAPSGASAPPRVVAVANVDRVEQLYPETPRAMQAVVRAFLKAGLVPFFSTLRATKRSVAADFVFQVVARGLSDWKSGTLVCAKAPEDSSWKVGDNVPLTRLPTIASSLSGRADPRP